MRAHLSEWAGNPRSALDILALTLRLIHRKVFETVCLISQRGISEKLMNGGEAHG